MVMADRYVADIRNGRKYRGASPANGFSEESSDEEERGGGGMRVGNDYQVKVPAFDPDAKPDNKADAILVWAPSPELKDPKIDEYLHISKEKHGYNMEQALGMLFWHKHNIEKALADLPNFTPFPDEWTVEDKVLFEQAFSFNGKNFHRIRQMLPDKSIAALVKYYYSWKKTRSRTSLMDRHAKKLTTKGEGDKIEEESENGSKNNSDVEEVKEDNKEETTCSNCGVTSSQLNPTPKGALCSSCYQYWRRTGVMRSTGPKRHEHSQHRHNPMRHKRKPPRGMYLSNEDLKAMVTGPPGQAEAILKNLDAELVTAKRTVQNNKQMISMQKHKMMSGIEPPKQSDNSSKINPKWTNEELLLAVQGVRKYGKDYAAIAEVIGTKTEAHVRSFYANFRRRYNLDEVLAEYEAEHGIQPSKDQPDDLEAMDVELKEDEVERAPSPVGPPTTAPPSTSAPPPLLKQTPAPEAAAATTAAR
ncbi:REST corepressor 1-like isoform X2 [Dreissena polymorpha]|uniref:REST corepressor 1-like isoform X2 n=1 Tax=Dreissena polymorpha TaxID=45954 RepID=UPI002263CF46|nr:REST corepressor 1-like isoform X2 [Dreissena polymorpha]